jgi:parallel beta-helix repeat protein
MPATITERSRRGPTLAALRPLFACVAVLTGAQALRADTTVCVPITAVPYVITQPGSYCLDRHLSTSAASGYAIRIQSNDVQIDLNGFTLVNTSAGNTAHGISTASVSYRNVTIRNGTVRGFNIGVYTGPGEGHFVDRIVADANLYVGIWLHGRGTVRDSYVQGTGGTTQSVFGIYGIVLYDQGSSAVNNNVMDTCGIESAIPCIGIYVLGASRSVLERNRVGQSTPLGIYTNRKGIYLNGSAGTTVSDNRLTNLNNGIEFASSSGPYRDNMCESCGTKYTGGTNAGNNY